MLKNHVVLESASFSASCKVSYRILSHPITTWMACETAALSKHRTSRTVRIPVRQKCPVQYTRPSLLLVVRSNLASTTAQASPIAQALTSRKHQQQLRQRLVIRKLFGSIIKIFLLRRAICTR